MVSLWSLMGDFSFLSKAMILIRFHGWIMSADKVWIERGQENSRGIRQCPITVAVSPRSDRVQRGYENNLQFYHVADWEKGEYLVRDQNTLSGLPFQSISRSRR